jgi:membrane protein DedA with SNARE-associated domain
MVFFLLGRLLRQRLSAVSRFAPAADRVIARSSWHPTRTILAVRFMYGLRTAGPRSSGDEDPVHTFVVVNAIGAVWSGAGRAGYALASGRAHSGRSRQGRARALMGWRSSLMFRLVAYRVASRGNRTKSVS